MKLIRVGAGFEDPWIDEGSGGSGDDVDDVIFQPATKTSVHTTTSSHPPDVTTVVSSVIRYVTTTVTQEQDAHTVKMSGFIGEKLYVFVGVLLGLVALAVGICVYIKHFHGRRDTHTFTPIRR
ncbi:hypothetical protein V1264_012111 [Littorina saxatilis]|uniref:Uncharacterized protein n=1 Tax=Littorina saxatilis TaxID=31220 RepID=A0AAN9GLM2_9CAEN